MPAWWRALFPSRPSSLQRDIDEVRVYRAQFGQLDDDALQRAARAATRLTEVVALAAVIASRVLGLQMFDVQIEGALALGHGHIVEMQTGEGKTLAAVPAIVWYARSQGGVHVLTANEYLAGRDADWMRPIYERFGLSVAAVRQDTTPEDRRSAYRGDVTYATAHEIGFDYLRDQLATHPDEEMLRPFAAVVIDEADSILIDEARVPLVIAGGGAEAATFALAADRVVRRLRPHVDFSVDRPARNIALTAAGAALVERLLPCTNLFDESNLPVMTAVQNALHAHVLLRRDVDYLVQEAGVLSIDESKGRIVHDRRWPADLQTALEVKERVPLKRQGRILGSITIENLVSLYPVACGMTGTAATQALDFKELYGLQVAVIPPNRPVIRHDDPDRVFSTRHEKERAVVEEIRRVHATGQPLLVGTSSVEESERLSAAIADVPHQVLNARNEAAEAAIVARAGETGAVTISTNMAGRGVDIRLGEGAAVLGGLRVIGTNRHESRRIDHQLRGRAGRQGDPGSSQFFVSREDGLVVKFASDAGLPEVLSWDQMQRVAEGQSLDRRLFLRKYESVVEGQRRQVGERRRQVLMATPPVPELERLVTLEAIDELWSDYLASVGELRAGTIWVSLSGGNPFRDYVFRVHEMFQEFTRTLDVEIAARTARAKTLGIQPRQRGATWTYLTTDEPFGNMTERVMRGLIRMFGGRRRSNL